MLESKTLNGLVAPLFKEHIQQSAEFNTMLLQIHSAAENNGSTQEILNLLILAKTFTINSKVNLFFEWRCADYYYKYHESMYAEFRSCECLLENIESTRKQFCDRIDKFRTQFNALIDALYQEITTSLVQWEQIYTREIDNCHERITNYTKLLFDSQNDGSSAQKIAQTQQKLVFWENELERKNTHFVVLTTKTIEQLALLDDLYKKEKHIDEHVVLVPVIEPEVVTEAVVEAGVPWMDEAIEQGGIGWSDDENAADENDFDDEDDEDDSVCGTIEVDSETDD